MASLRKKLRESKMEEPDKDSTKENLNLHDNQCCDICEFVSKSSSGLKTHKTVKHREENGMDVIKSAAPPYCPECDLTYMCEEVLIFREHCRVEHEWLWCKNWFKGDGCEFATTEKKELKKHMKVCQLKPSSIPV